jgi:hypothetical protein
LALAVGLTPTLWANTLSFFLASRPYDSGYNALLVLDDYGLVSALHWYGEQFATRTAITVTVEGEEPVLRMMTITSTQP